MNEKQEYERTVLRLGEIEAMINYWKRAKLNTDAQAQVVHLKNIKKSLEKKLKGIVRGGI